MDAQVGCELFKGGCRLFRAVICCSGGYMDVQECCILFMGVICCAGMLYGCSGMLYSVQGVISCSGGLYAVQEGYRDVQEGYMLKKIMMFIVATNVIAIRPTGMPLAHNIS